MSSLTIALICFLSVLALVIMGLFLYAILKIAKEADIVSGYEVDLRKNLDKDKNKKEDE